MKRNFTILLLMLLCISLLTPVYAAQAIPSEVFGEEAINQAIDNYFQSRKDFLKGNRNDTSVRSWTVSPFPESR